MTDIDTLKAALLEKSENSQITCAQCFEVAEELGIEKDGLAQLLTDMDIRIIKCQLGCF